MSSSDSLEITSVAPDRLPQALALAFSNLSPRDAAIRVEAALAEIRWGRLSQDGILQACRGGRLVGASFTQVLSGRTANFWPPQVLASEPRETVERLIGASIDRIRGDGVRVAHALLEGQPRPSDVMRLKEAGFSRLAELYYLLSEEEDFPAEPPGGPLLFEPYTPEKYERLCQIVEQTYEATRDCPGLDGVRDAAEVLEGYGAFGEPPPQHWLFVRHGDRDVGCLLIGDHPEHENCELTYMGLTCSARGNGWGSLIARHAQWVARRLGRPRLVLAVDAANGPARRAYARAGFRGFDRRQVYILIL
ncbi:MAG: GNAT family N-acetyltransferase [Thermoguttaceae bacterium]|jgi:RimJ/RimL family protein N-acetyltransferase